jgi:hypothetical protein
VTFAPFLLYLLPVLISLGRWLWDKTHQPKPAVDYALTPTRKTMKPGETAVLRIVPLDANGNVTIFDAGVVPTWTPPDASLGTSTLSTDAMSVAFVPSQAGTDLFGVSVTLAGAPVTHSATVVVAAGAATDYRIDVTLPQT